MNTHQNILNNETKEKMIAFKKALIELVESIQENNEDATVVKMYPFNKSLEEIEYDVIEWVNENTKEATQ